MHIINFKEIANDDGVYTGITTRKGGVSEGKYSSFNLSFNAGDNPEKVFRNRELLAEYLNISSNNLFFPDQCHTNNVSSISKAGQSLPKETDALVTNELGIALGVLAADCVPVLFYDRYNKVIAAAHAGWRGTVTAIVIKVIDVMKTKYQCNPADISVGIGPCISKGNYEVGAEVIEAINKLGFQFADNHAHHLDKKRHGYVNLQGINHDLLVDAGVPSDNIEIMQLCTFENPDLFFSARRDGFHSGRFASVIMLR
jgi:YfiH family protein